MLLQKRRDKAAAKRLFRRGLRSNPVPRTIVTDQLRSYPAAKADISELAQANQERFAAWHSWTVRHTGEQVS